MTLLDARIGHIIKRERQKKKLTLNALGLLVGANHSTLTNYETGRRRVPPQRVIALAEALGIDPRLIDPLAAQDGEPPKVEREYTQRDISPLRRQNYDRSPHPYICRCLRVHVYAHGMTESLSKPDRILTVEELAAEFKISRSHAYRLKKQQAWPHHKFGTEIRFSAEDIQAIQAMNRQRPQQDKPVKRAPRIGTRAKKSQLESDG